MKTVKDVTERIQKLLNCGQLAVTELIGASKNTINDNKDILISKWNTKGLGSRLTALLYVVENLKISFPDLPKEGQSFALRQSTRKDPRSGFPKSCLFLIQRGEVENLDYVFSLAKEAAELYYKKKSDKIRSEVIFNEVLAMAKVG